MDERMIEAILAAAGFGFWLGFWYRGRLRDRSIRQAVQLLGKGPALSGCSTLTRKAVLDLLAAAGYRYEAKER